ncbi:GNAT family N-acetyltransferase [Frondihabitans sucicola]|uniref:GNAT family N-acetyltransferase n=1 Tax=Frondihabitans sucicola TaxID=1268041 RepID=UPI0025736965|nr:GNAT family N-acetyltransferase [Frondihabitans sucicola]
MNELPALTVEHVDWNDPRAEALRHSMEVEMDARYADKQNALSPAEQEELERSLAVDPGKVFVTVLVSDADGVPVGHAALKDLRGDWEMKRVIVDASRRGAGIGALLMTELAKAARAGGARRIILQTGDRQPEAVRLYERSGYTPIPIYEPYASTIPFSLCYELVL